LQSLPMVAPPSTTQNCQIRVPDPIDRDWTSAVVWMEDDIT